MRGNDYVIGALVLARSLTRTIHQTVCMVTSDVSERAVALLQQAFDRVKLIENINMPCRKLNTDKQEKMYGAWRPWTHLSLTCFRCLLLEDCEKICLMDSNVVVLRNMDNIFELDSGYPCSHILLFLGTEAGIHKPTSWQTNLFQGDPARTHETGLMCLYYKLSTAVPSRATCRAVHEMYRAVCQQKQ
jgi:alpha-N-acetylglucosamine transferase